MEVRIQKMKVEKNAQKGHAKFALPRKKIVKNTVHKNIMTSVFKKQEKNETMLYILATTDFLNLF